MAWAIANSLQGTWTLSRPRWFDRDSQQNVELLNRELGFILESGVGCGSPDPRDFYL